MGRSGRSGRLGRLRMVKGMRRWGLGCIAAILIVASGALPTTALAQSGGLTSRAIEGGIGFTSGPNTFLMAFGLPLGLTRNVSIVPLIQLGFNDHRTLVAPTASLRYGFSLQNSSVAALRPVRPFIEGGLGLLYIDHRSSDDVGFLMNVGIGLEYPLNDDVSLTSAMRFNGAPDAVVGENFFYSWQVLGAQLHF